MSSRPGGRGGICTGSAPTDWPRPGRRWPSGSSVSHAWAGPQDPADAEAITASGWFDEPVMSTASERLVLPAEAVVRIEGTRSTVLNWPPEARAQFLQERTKRLRSQPKVPLTRVSWVTTAKLARWSAADVPG